MRKHLNYANVIATLALVFAMSGGALAAKHYLINSTNQINPKVLKSLKGNAGPAGHAGTAGPQGKEGSPGKEGPAGKEGGPGKTGLEGKEGKEGAPGATDAVTRYGPEASATSGNTATSYAACESNEAVTGGGYDFTEGPANGKYGVYADRPSIESFIVILGFHIPIFPDPENGAKATGWYTDVNNETGSSLKLRSYVLCASP